MRKCAECGSMFWVNDLAAVETLRLEADRHAAGLDGMSFRYYVCRYCDDAVIFVELLRQHGETEAAFLQRYEEMERMVGELDGDGVAVVLEGERPLRSTTAARRSFREVEARSLPGSRYASAGDRHLPKQNLTRGCQPSGRSFQSSR